jgi:KaiC/GvpD/RAD55 family RecA-like ATPase
LTEDRVNPDVERRIRQVYGQGLKKEGATSDVNRVAVGIPGFDEILGGGFPQGRVLLVLGEPGAGKTVLGSQFLLNGIERFSENGMFVSLKESLGHYNAEMGSFGWDFAKAEKEGRFSFIDASPIRAVPGEVKIDALTLGREKFSLISLLETIRKNAKTIGARRVVVDSLSMLELQYPDAVQRRKAILDIVEALSETGATCVLTTDFTSIGLEQFTTLEDFLRFSIIQFEKQFFHGVISMQTVPAGRAMERIITVEKMYATQIDRQPRPYRITKKGIEVYPRESII